MPLIDNDYVYLEIPFYVNPGDILIWKGTEDFFKRLPYKCLYRASAVSYEDRNIPKDAIILLQGGGNFGDLYRINQNFRNKIIQSYPNHKIIILPQTVYYRGYNCLVQDKIIHRKHKNLHICVRDAYSYRFLKWQGFSKNIYLVPDMAFAIDLEYLNNFSLPETDKELLFRRTDAEFRNDSVKGDFHNIDCSDWTLFESPDQIVHKLDSMIWGPSKLDSNIINEYLLDVFFPHQIESAVKQISPYRKLYCTRLHAAILSILLGKEVVILDNSYGKNSHFFNTWLQGIEGVSISRARNKIAIGRLVRMIAALFVR